MSELSTSHSPAHAPIALFDPELIRRFEPHTRVFDVALDAVMRSVDSASAPPAVETIAIHESPDGDPSRAQLFVGRRPFARRNWSLDQTTNTLLFGQGRGAERIEGRIELTPEGKGFGSIQLGDSLFSALIQLKPVTYDLSIATDAAYASGSSSAPQLNFDPASERWKKAEWTAHAMRLRFGLKDGPIIVGQKTYTLLMEFEDLATGETWKPLEGTYSATMDANQRLLFQLVPGAAPGDLYGRPFTSRRFPYMLVAQFAPSAQSANGAVLTVHPDLTGTTLGIQAAYDGKALSGLYALTHAGMPESAEKHVVQVDDGQLWIDHERVASSQLRGNVLQWDALPAAMRSKTGLPERGHLVLSAEGIVGSDFEAVGARITPDEAAVLAPALGHLAATQTLLADVGAFEKPSKLDPQTLLNLTQWERLSDGTWRDSVQAKAMNDFYRIVQHHTPRNLADQFLGSLQPLDQRLAAIAAMRGPKNTDPKSFYEDLSIAYLAAALPQSVSDKGTKLLNARRASIWMRSRTAASDVFTTQSTRLYSDRYIEKNRAISDYLVDQQDNAARWALIIDDDVRAWKEEMKAALTGSPDEIARMMEEIDRIGAAGKDKRYWAYFVFRYTTNPAFLQMLQLISFAPAGVEGSAFMRRVQQITAQLQILDPSSFFTRQFLYTVQLFSVGNVMPQLFETSAAPEEYEFAATKVLEAFIDTHLDSPDADLRQAAQELDKIRQQGRLKDLSSILQQSGAAAPGLFSWEAMAAKFESRVAQVFGKLPKIALGVVAMSTVAVGIMFFVTGQIQWSSLTTMQQVALVGPAAAVVTKFVMAIVQKGIAFSEVFQPGVGAWRSLRVFFSAETLTTAETRLLTGFRGWLIRGRAGAENMITAARTLAADAVEGMAILELQAEQRMTAPIRIFGRGFDEFMATRLGAFLAGAALVMSAIMAARSTEPLEKAANILFSVASAVELIAAVGGWALSASVTLGETAVGAVVASALPWLGPAAIVIAIAGAIVLFVYLFKPQPTPAEKFAKNEAKAKGFYMEHGAEIDSFEFFQPAGQPQRAGIALLANGSDALAVRLSPAGMADVAPQDHTAATSFYLSVDETGRAQFIAPLEDKGVSAPRVLAVDDKNNVVAAAVAAAPDNHRQLWRAVMLGDATREGTNVVSASFAFVNDAVPGQYLTVNGGKLALAAAPLSWVVKMITTVPSGLSMRDVILTTLSKDARRDPALTMPGSEPRTWTISPELPPFLELDSRTGRVSQKPGVAPPLTAPKTYSLSVTNGVGTATAAFKLSVVEAQA
jgi:hypothetical protein